MRLAWMAVVMTCGVAAAQSAPGHAPEARIPKKDSGVSVAYGTPKVRGKLDKTRVGMALRTDARAHAGCFAEVNRITALPSGPATIALDVGGDGAVVAVRVTAVHGELAACLQRRVRLLALPKTKDGQPAHVEVKLTFTKKPKNR